ncbi:MAG: hypothetical protein KKH94_01550, partial [Candidatus Omnitrophica bacterium]|nr:hypothetical protein [Candidatus Omnitrophota bacterium]
RSISLGEQIIALVKKHSQFEAPEQFQPISFTLLYKELGVPKRERAKIVRWVQSLVQRRLLQLTYANKLNSQKLLLSDDVEMLDQKGLLEICRDSQWKEYFMTRADIKDMMRNDMMSVLSVLPGENTIGHELEYFFKTDIEQLITKKQIIAVYGEEKGEEKVSYCSTRKFEQFKEEKEIIVDEGKRPQYVIAEENRPYEICRNVDWKQRFVTMADIKIDIAKGAITAVYVLPEENLLERDYEYMAQKDVELFEREGKIIAVYGERDGKRRVLYCSTRAFNYFKSEEEIITVRGLNGTLKHIIFGESALYAEEITNDDKEELFEIVRELIGKEYEAGIKEAYKTASGFFGRRKNKKGAYFIDTATELALNTALFSTSIFPKDKERCAQLIAAALIFNIPLSHLKAEDPAIVRMGRKARYLVSKLPFNPPSKDRYDKYYVDKFKNMIKDTIDTPEELVLYLIIKMMQLELLQYEKMKSIEQRRISDEMIYVVAALAQDYGLKELSIEIKRRTFRALRPSGYDYYRNLRNTKLGMTEYEADEYKKYLISELKNRLQQEGVDIEKIQITGRIKNPLSIKEKVVDRKVTFEEILDLIALRIVTKTEKECWKVLSVLRKIFQGKQPLWEGEIEERFKDYISRPKSSGYRALHLIVNHVVNKNVLNAIKGSAAITGGGSPQEIAVEIQIKTKEMDRFAQSGSAADTIRKAITHGHKH